MERRTFIVAALLAILIAVPFVSMEISARPSPDEGCTILGVSAESTTGFQTYTLDLTYESKTVGTKTSYLLKMESTYTPPESPDIGPGESSGEFGKDVVIRICQGGYTSGDHRAQVADSKDIRIKYGTDLGIERFYMPGGTESKLPNGEYIVQIRTSSNDKLIVENALYVVDIQKITFAQPSEGSVDAQDVYVPKGSVATADDDVLTITYSPTGGVYTKNTVAVVKAVPPSGLEVDGWYVGDSKITTRTLNADTEIEVRWAEFRYVITYNANGGSGAPAEQVEYSGETVHKLTLSTTRPIWSEYTFAGWSETPTGPVQYRPGGTITLTSDDPERTLFAVWESSPGPGPGPSSYSYILSYDANGGSGAPESQTMTTAYNRWTFTVSSVVPIREGCTFLGWADTATAESPSYHAGSSITLTSSSTNKTIFAVWKETPVVPDPKDVTISVDEIHIPQGDSWKLSFTVDPPEAASAVVWGSSDETVATVSGGTVTALKEGTVTITAYDREGKALDSVTIVVVSPSERTVEEEIKTEAGGSVIATYEIGPEGKRVLVNPIVINPGDLKRVTEDQMLIAEGYIDILVGSGIAPQVIIPTTEQTVTVPAELLQAIAESEGSLRITEGDVTVTLSAGVLTELGYLESLELVVIPVEVKEDADLPEIDGDSKVYDIYILLDEQRVTRVFENQIPVTVSYQLEDGRTVDRLHVYYIDVEPFEEFRFTYDSEGVHFGVHHFSHYALVYDISEDSEQCCIWCWILIAAIVILVLFLLWFFLAKRIKVVLDPDGGRFMFESEGWSTQDDGTFVRRFRYREESDAFPVPVRDGMRFDGWDPQPDQRIICSSNHKAVWSDPYAGRIGSR